MKVMAKNIHGIVTPKARMMATDDDKHYILCCVFFALLITPFTFFPYLTGDSVFENYLPIEQPTILEELQNILSKYPDGAQILRVSSQ